MTAKPARAGEVVKIRTAFYEWAPLLLTGVVWFAVSSQRYTLHETQAASRPDDVALAMLVAVIFVAEGLWLRSFGVDLGPEYVKVRGIRRRTIAWSQVQAVLRSTELGCGGVRLVFEDGRSIGLRAPTSFLGTRQGAYEQDYHRIGQWWLEHRGPSWRPMVPEAPNAQR